MAVAPSPETPESFDLRDLFATIAGIKQVLERVEARLLPDSNELISLKQAIREFHITRGDLNAKIKSGELPAEPRRLRGGYQGFMVRRANVAIAFKVRA